MSLDFDIRYSTMDDLELLQRYFSAPGSTDDFPFNEKEKGDALKNWIGFSKFKASLTGVIKDQVIAVGTLFLMPYKKVAHHCTFYLIVDPEFRNQGVGTSMVKNLKHLAKTRFRLEALQVEIFENSKLIPILKDLGFEQQFSQENFAHVNNTFLAREVWESSLK